MGCQTRKVSTIGLDYWASWHMIQTIWSSRSNDAWGVRGRQDVVWSLWRHLQWIITQDLRIWNEDTHTPIFCRYSSFKKQLLACHWALVETECLAMGHQVTTRCELSIMNWMLSNPPSHKVLHTQWYSMIKCQWSKLDQALKAQVTWRIGWNADGPYFCCTAFSLQTCNYGLKGHSLWSVDRGKEN